MCDDSTILFFYLFSLSIRALLNTCIFGSALAGFFLQIISVPRVIAPQFCNIQPYKVVIASNFLIQIVERLEYLEIIWQGSDLFLSMTILHAFAF